MPNTELKAMHTHLTSTVKSPAPTATVASPLRNLNAPLCQTARCSWVSAAGRGLVLVALTVASLTAQAADGTRPASAATSTNAASLDPHLEPLRPLLGKTWRGPFKNSRPEKPVVDIMTWERVLNGKAVRTLHSINEGSYGGETLYRWDPEKQVVTYHYFTTAGFMTTGTVKFDGPVWTTHEMVSGASGDVTEVRATARLEADGTFSVKTEHRNRAGDWGVGHETVYREDPSARVIFR